MGPENRKQKPKSVQTLSRKEIVRSPYYQIEQKWMKRWNKDQLYKADNNSSKPTFTCIDMYPYPSGEGLHVGHVEGYTGSDILSRSKRMQGYEVLHPMGWDAFGLPTETYAIKTGKDPHQVTKENAEVFREQCKRMGFSIDWDREIDTSNKEYYKFTQEIFLKLFGMGLAYKAEGPVNWCGDCKTAISNDQAKGGHCERCSSPVEIKNIEQWYLKITDYAEKLLQDINKLNWPESTKEAQRNWIGRTEGFEIKIDVAGEKTQLNLFLTEPETLEHATYLLVAQDHPLVLSLITENARGKVSQYMATHSLVEMERKKNTWDSGIATGKFAINPITEKMMEIRITNSVLMDEYDGIRLHNEEQPQQKEARKKALADLGNKALPAVHYKMRDWLVSRERYWGAPIPIVNCERCGDVPVPVEQLPIELPTMENFAPTGIPPLARVPEFVNTTCPCCNGAATREPKTLDTFVDSAWYYMRYSDPHNEKKIGDPELLKRWMPVDYYIGGSDHATGHLLYSRFITKVLFDLGEIPFDEPFTQLFHQGMILGADGRKMSKRFGNGIRPEDVADEFGSDALRIAEMFMGPLEQSKIWSIEAVVGSRKFLDKIWTLFQNVDALLQPSPKELQLIDRLVLKITDNIDKGKFNVAVSDFMTYIKKLDKSISISKQVAEKFLKLLAPFAPFITEELWEKMGNRYSIHRSEWPQATVKLDEVSQNAPTIPITVNGKRIGVFPVPDTQYDLDKLIELLSTSPEIAEKLKGKAISDVRYIPGTIVNFISK